MPDLDSKDFQESIIIRPAKLRDAKFMGRIAAITYFMDPLTAFLSPRRFEYYSSFQRDTYERSVKPLLQPRVCTLVACEASRLDLPIGYIRFQRLGDDAPAKAFIKERDTLRLRILSWVAWAWFQLLFFLLGKPHADPGALEIFDEVTSADDKLHWEFEDRKCRYYVQSFVVLPIFQGKGVGKKLMAEVTRRAEEENVIIGIEASAHGEFLVR